MSRFVLDQPTGGRARRALGAAVLTSISLVAVGVSTATASGPPLAAHADGPQVDADGTTALPATPDGPGAEYIVQLEDGTDVDAVVADVVAGGVEVIGAMKGAIDGFTAPLDAASRAELRARDDVVRVERRQVVEMTGVQDNPPWGLNRIDQRALPLDSKYGYRNTGAGVDAYVVDSGLNKEHVEFSGRLKAGVYIDYGDGMKMTDCSGHGTHVAGTVGGTTWGVAKGVSIVPVKVFQCGVEEVYVDDVILGLNWVIEHHKASQPAVANMSLGGPESQVLDDAVKVMIADGITVVASAGNDENISSCDHSPGQVPEAITVAASASNDERAWFSSPGSCNDLFAPGVDIESASHSSNNGSVVFSGTSMAAPHVAGAAALLLQQNPTYTPAQVWAAIDADTTTGVITGEGTGDPDKLLHVTPPAVATAPTGLSAAVAPTADVGSGEVKLTWTAPFDGGAAITDYVIERSTDRTAWTTVADGESTATTYTDRGLSGGTSYWFRVSAKNAVGTGPASTDVQAVPIAFPAAPTGLTAAVAPAAGVGPGEVKLSWIAPSSNGGSPIWDYLIERSTDGTTWSPVNDGVSTNTTYTVSGLSNGTPYWFRVSARNSLGVGPPTEPASATPATLPAAPSGLTAAVAPAPGVGSGEAKLTWTAPSGNGSAITDYVIESSLDGTTWSPLADPVSPTTGHTVVNLIGGTSYRFRVAAKNSVGTGPWSTSVTATPATEPAAPSGLTAEVAPAAGVGSGEVKLSWTAPSRNGSAITDYVIDRSTDGVTWTRVDDGVTPSTTSLLRGLSNATQYRFRIAAANGVGTGPWSTTVSATPVGPPEAPGGLTTAVAPAAGVGAGQVKLSWTAPSGNGSAITDYTITWSEDGAAWQTANDGPSTETTYTLDGLTSGRSHEFRVAAVNAVGSGVWSATVTATPTGPPAAPSGLAAAVAPAAGVGSGQVRLTWTAPSGNGAAITDYVIQRSTDDSTWTTVSDGVSTDTTSTVTGLTNGTRYSFRVTAVNNIDAGPTSAPIQAAPVWKPGATGSLTAAVAPATGVGSGQVKLAWSSPTDDGASPITDYVVHKSTDGSTWTTVSEGVSTDTTSTVTGLTNGTRYSFRVTARNAVGDGPTSAPIQATPVWKPASPGGLTAAVAPATGVGSGQVKLAWSAPTDDGGTPITDYVIQRSTNGLSWTTLDDGASTATTYTVTGLTNGTRYSFRVTARNAIGAGARERHHPGRPGVDTSDSRPHLRRRWRRRPASAPARCASAGPRRRTTVRRSPTT